MDKSMNTTIRTQNDGFCFFCGVKVIDNYNKCPGCGCNISDAPSEWSTDYFDCGCTGECTCE